MAKYTTFTANTNSIYKANVCWSFIPAKPSLRKVGVKANNSTALTMQATVTAPTTGTFYVNNIRGYRTSGYTSSNASTNYVNICVGGTWNNGKSQWIYYKNNNVWSRTGISWSSQAVTTSKTFNLRTNSGAIAACNAIFNSTVNCGVSLTATEYSKDNSTYQSSPTFTGLTPNTTYTLYARTRADSSTSNNSGYAYTSSTVRTPCSEPKNLAITQEKAAKNFLRLNWSGAGDTNAAITRWDVYRGLKSAFALDPVYTGTETSKTFYGLDENEKYLFAVRAANSGGETVYINLPDEYQQVEYIEATGTQYIDSGYKPCGYTRIAATYQFTAIEPTQQRVFGCEGALSMHSYINGNGNMAWASQNDTGNWTATAMKADTLKHTVIIDNYNDTLRYGNMVDGTITTTHSNTATYSMYFGAQNVSGSVVSQALIKMYRYSIYEQDKLLRVYIPCYRKSDNVIGMYEPINGVFYTNAGTGTFTKGANVTNEKSIFATASSKIYSKTKQVSGYTRVEYIESSGTQWIDTGLNALSFNSRFSCDLDFKMNEAPAAWRMIMGAATGDVNGTWYWGPSVDFGVDTLNRFRLETPTSATLGSTDINTPIHNVVAGTKRHFAKIRITQKQQSLEIDGFRMTTSQEELSGPSCNIHLFTRAYIKENSSYTKATYASKMRLYSAKIRDEKGNMLRNYIPCLRDSDKKPGLYDLQNNVFYVNSGTGEFTYGPEQPWVKGKSFIKRTLPDTYQAVEYIQSSGTQYINTGVYDEAGVMAQADIEWTSYGGNYATMLGAQEKVDGSSLGSNSLFMKYSSTNNASVYAGTVSGNSGIQIELNKKCHYEASTLKDNPYIKINELYYYYTSDGVRGVKPLFIFALNNGGSANYFGSGKLYNMRIYSAAGVLLRDFKPCYRKSDNVIGLYDLKNNVFYTNAGTGTFTKGSNIDSYWEQPEQIYFKNTDWKIGA